MKIAKKTLAMVLSLMLLLGLAACGGGTSSAAPSFSAAPSASGSEAGSVPVTDMKLGFLAPTLQNEFFIGIDDDLKAGCADRGWEYTSVSFENDSATAVTSIENMVSAGCTAILAMVSDTSCDDALRAAQEAGVIIIECGVETEVYDICLNTNQYAVGEAIGNMAGEWIAAQLGGEAKAVVYTTYQNTDMQNRGQGIQDALAANYPGVTILEVVDIGKDVVGSGTTTTETMLQKYPDLNVIISYGDAAATESVEAVKAAGRDSDDFGIFACDATESALNYIASGDIMRGTVGFEPIADSVFEYTERFLAGETFPEMITLPSNAVTAENVSEYL